MKGLFLILYIIDLEELLMDTSDVPSVHRFTDYKNLGLDSILVLEEISFH